MARNEQAPTWREMAVARSLDSARTRAENRVQRFLDAALDLMNEGSGREFTVQEVVERSGQSLRSFYQFFDGKHELLLALFEDAVRVTAGLLQERLAEEDDALERLHAFVIEYYRLCRPLQRGKAVKTKVPPAVMADFAQQLLTEYPKEAARAFEPVVALFREVLADAVKKGAVRKDLNQDQVAGVVLQEVMFHAFSSTISGAPLRANDRDAGEDLWDLIFYGIGAPG
ncbi:MAG TPA: TetR/AcrR family transcriptional regulator [Acidimicrobiales bacterium]|nr:TetR/AcrR family transcriptional regulator [Acidimicrobiales bacterium]